MSRPFQRAPTPTAPEKDQPIAGASTAPTTARRLTVSPIDTENNGNPCEKFVVPSSGSTYQTRPNPRPPVPARRPAPTSLPSSPTMVSSGKAAASRETTSASERRSNSVTRSMSSDLNSNVRPGPPPFANNSRPLRAATVFGDRARVFQLVGRNGPRQPRLTALCASRSRSSSAPANIRAVVAILASTSFRSMSAKPNLSPKYPCAPSVTR